MSAKQKRKVSKKVENPTPIVKGRLTLQRLLAEGAEIWVINNSAKVTGKEAGDIVFQTGSGNIINPVLIPPGKDPVCLTDQVTQKMLADCVDLFKLVNSKVLKLLDPADAEVYYAQHVGRKDAVDAKIKKFTSGAQDDVPKPTSRSANIQINPKVGDICLKSRHAAVSEQEALERLFEQEDVLSEDDLSYLLSNGVYAGVKRWAKDQLNKKSIQESDPAD